MSSLARPTNGRMIGGVCAALARRFGTSATTMRVVFVASCLLPGPQFLLYMALWILLPSGTRPARPGRPGRAAPSPPRLRAAPSARSPRGIISLRPGAGPCTSEHADGARPVTGCAPSARRRPGRSAAAQRDAVDVDALARRGVQRQTAEETGARHLGAQLVDDRLGGPEALAGHVLAR